MRRTGKGSGLKIIGKLHIIQSQSRLAVGMHTSQVEALSTVYGPFDCMFASGFGAPPISEDVAMSDKASPGLLKDLGSMLFVNSLGL